MNVHFILGTYINSIQVRHSQRCNDTPLRCWVLCECTGEIICAHCNCMAGLGEVCTHVGAMLFYVETTTRLSGLSQCTQEKCSWVVPTYQNAIPYVPISQIDFSSAKNKMKSIDAVINSSAIIPDTTTSSTRHNSTQHIQQEQSTTRLQHFYSELSK